MILKPKPQKQFEERVGDINIGLKILQVVIVMLIIVIGALVIKFIKDNF